MNNSEEGWHLKLKSLRINNNLTLLEVANSLGYKYPSSYRKIENGEQTLKANQIKVLAKLFNCSEQKILNSSYSK